MKRNIGVLVFSFILSMIISAPATAGTVNLFGTVYRNDHSPAVGYGVSIYSNQTKWVGPVVTDSSGRFAFFGIPGGQYLVSVSLYDKEVWRGGTTASGQPVEVILP
jgi:hypothetical protein